MTRKKILFTDWRDIQCGAVAWLTPEGKRYRVGNPPEPQVSMRAEPRFVPRGIRLQAQPARKAGPMENYKGWGRIIFDEAEFWTTPILPFARQIRLNFRAPMAGEPIPGCVFDEWLDY